MQILATQSLVDLNQAKIEAPREGEIPIFEPGLDQLVASNVKDERLLFTTELEPAVADADVVFIAVGTPYDAAKGSDGIVLITEWSAFRSLDLGRLREAMSGSAFIDLRNVYRRKEVEGAGFVYTSVGRPEQVERSSSAANAAG